MQVAEEGKNINQNRVVPVGSEVQTMFASIAKRYDLTNTVLSMGTHHLWKNRLVGKLDPKQDIRVLDLCCGTGDVYRKLRQKFSCVTGLDFCLPMLEVAKENLSSSRLLLGSVEELPIQDSTFDAVTVAFGIRNLSNLEKGLEEIRRVLKPGGKILVLEFGQPSNKVWGLLYSLYSKYIMPALGGLFTGNMQAYKYLPETAKKFPCGERFLKCLKEVGFSSLESESVFGGIAYIYSARS